MLLLSILFLIQAKAEQCRNSLDPLSIIQQVKQVNTVLSTQDASNKPRRMPAQITPAAEDDLFFSNDDLLKFTKNGEYQLEGDNNIKEEDLVAYYKVNSTKYKKIREKYKYTIDAKAFEEKYGKKIPEFADLGPPWLYVQTKSLLGKDIFWLVKKVSDDVICSKKPSQKLENDNEVVCYTSSK